MGMNETYKFGVSKEDLDIVKATLPLVGKAGTDFTKHFYKRMFSAHPELLNVFNQTNQAKGKQPKKLLATVALAAQAAIETGKLSGEAIEGICQKHAALHVGADAYAIVGEHLLGTIEDLLTKDKAILNAWGSLYGDIAKVFVTREAEITKEAACVPGGWDGRRTFVLEKKEEVSSIVTRFTFRPKDGEPVPELQAGKFTTIWVPMNDEGPHGQYTEQPRHYTLNAARNDEERSKALCISVKKDGAVSGILHVAEVGSEWEMSAPFGCFLMAGVEQLWVSAPDTPVVFMSGGIGMTPVMAMLENVYSTHPASWLHVNKNGGVHAYRERLRDITSVKNGDLKRRIWYTAPRQEDGEPGDMSYPDTFNSANYHFKGRMDLNNEELLSSNVLHLDNPNTHYFMCGPSEFMDDQKAVLMKMGVVESRIHSEGF